MSNPNYRFKCGNCGLELLVQNYPPDDETRFELDETLQEHRLTCPRAEAVYAEERSSQ